MMNDTTVDSLFRDALARFPDRVFLRIATDDSARCYTYREVSVAVHERVVALHAAGLRTGDVVLTAELDVTVSILISIACAHAGIVLLPVSAALPAAALLAAQERVGAKALIADMETAHVFRAPGHFPIVFDSVVRTPVSDDEARDAARALRSVAETHCAGDVFQLAQSTGTTGRPKIVVRTHVPIVLGARALAFDDLDTGSAERILIVLRTTGALGSFVLAAALALAAEVAIPSRSRIAPPAIALEPTRRDLALLAPTYLAIMPRTLRQLHQERLESHHTDLALVPASVRTVYLGPVVRLSREAPLIEEMQRAGIDVRGGYGTSELSPFCFMTQRGRWSIDRACGVALPDVEYRLEADEICVRSPGLMCGYLEEPSRPPSAFTPDGLYRTGDCFDMRPDGQLVYLGRKGDAIRTQDGTRVHLTYLEELIEWHIDEVEQVLLVADARPYVVALIVVRPPVGPEGIAPDGLLDERVHPTRYEAMRRRIAEVVGPNAVREVALFENRFPPELYRVTPVEYKTYRDRPALERMYAAEIQALYR